MLAMLLCIPEYIFAYQQRYSEYQEKDNRTCDIAIIHNVLIDSTEWIQDS